MADMLSITLCVLLRSSERWAGEASIDCVELKI